MRQNASSLAGICILSTMLTVTLTGTLALYLGQEETLKPLYPYNVCYHIIQNEENPDPQMTPTAIDAFLAEPGPGPRVDHVRPDRWTVGTYGKHPE